MFIGFGFWSLGAALYGVFSLMSATDTTEMAWGVGWILAGFVMWRVLWRSNW